MRRMKTIVLLLLLAPPLRAARSGASFLTIGAGARAAGMGSAFTATADDATAAYWNPAGLSGMKEREASATHVEWAEGMAHEHLAYAHPAGDATWAAGVTSLSLGNLERRGDDGRLQGGFGARDLAAGLSFARPLPLGRGARAGVTVKWIEQKIGDERAAGAAADLGFMKGLGTAVTLGLSVRNLGPGLTFLREKHRLPLSVNAGGRYGIAPGLSLSMDLHRMDRRTSFSVGTEYWLAERIAFRGGYLTSGRAFSPGAAGSIRSTPGFNMGLGLRLDDYRMDYALVPSSAFGSTHHLSVSRKFRR